ncbi:MAG: UvrD-helicase domain-containing protein, partial [Actinomycetota bacterium]|nr:UvrD-helicase domain-containing protein [Actinomycetota bacterium]
MTVTVAAQPFNLCDPLPAGVTLLEASAGTGKTFTIAALATRYVADGLPLENLLLVTFTRMATSELRDRVREQMVSAEQGLTRALAGAESDAAEQVVGLLASGSTEEITRRRDHLAAALSDFDAATIATTHGFCQHVLSGLGVAGDVGRDVTFVEDPRDLVDEVVADLYVRKFHRGGDPPFTLAVARKVGEKAMSNPDAVLEPSHAPPDSPANLRWRLACKVREEVDRRRRLAGVLTYDDLLTRLKETLADPERGQAARRRLRTRHKVALVDEFQDTDPIQWEIMSRAFAEPGAGATLVLIGDPKQAIYSFRGADVFAYLDAATLAGTKATLQLNWRSHQGLLDAYDALFAGARLGHEGIVYRDVGAAEANRARPMTGAPVGAPLRVRLLHRQDRLVKLTPKGYLNAAGARERVADDLAADVVRLLSSPAEIATSPGEEPGTPRTPIRPGHVAVLVHRNRDAIAVHDALGAVGVRAVLNGAGSVFDTPAARAWLRLLDALERPSSPNAAKTAALTPFLGWTAERVATAGEGQWEELHARLHGWAAMLRRLGVAALLETISVREGLARRVLGRSDGERQLTDIGHLGQLLHAVATAEQLGVTALAGWLRQRMAEAGEEVEAEDRSRRLESDADAVQVLTIYRSKGLEFPGVYCPSLWDPGWIPDDNLPVFHDTTAGYRRTIDVGGETDKWTGTGWQHVV